jgi:hypothetical protein
VNFEAETELVPITPDQDAELRAIALERAPLEVAAVEQAENRDDLFFALPGAAISAYRLGDSVAAHAYANQALDLAAQYENNWNRGNAIHFAHTTLGLLALQDGRTSAAEAELLASATAGSPQLDTFGPSMQLARELLKQGRTEPVLQYLERCRSFWKMGAVWLDLWEAKVRAGQLPNFLMNLYR